MNLDGLRSRYDVVIVGARVAGAATAMRLARAGLRVLAVDQSPEGSDTLSTHALMRGAVLQLARWGVLPAIEAAGTPAIRTTTFHYGDEAIAIPIKPRDGVDALRAPRRTILDPVLVAAARAAGADVRYRMPVRELLRDARGRVRGVLLSRSGGAVVRVRAGIVVGADGMRSSIADLVSAKMHRLGTNAAPTVYRYMRGGPPDGYHWFYRPGVSAGTIPTNGGLYAVFVALPRARYERERPHGLESMFSRALVEAAPDLAARMTADPLAGPVRGFAGEPGFLRQPSGPGWALVGDAGAFRDPITSHGISDALRDAEWLASAIARGGERALAEYGAARDELMRDMIPIADRVASFEWTLDEVRALHLALSRVMTRAVEAILLGTRGVRAAGDQHAAA
jgi:menaquinone-9 beta-reductase